MHYVDINLDNSTGPIHSNAIVVGCGLGVRQDAKPSVIHVLDKKGHELVPSSQYFVDIAGGNK